MELNLQTLPEECRNCPFLSKLLLSCLGESLKLTEDQLGLLDKLTRELSVNCSPQKCNSDNKGCPGNSTNQ